MHISGFQSGYNSNTKKEKKRVAKFKHEHCIGQIVEATYVDTYGQGLNWVKINGHYLLANITEPSEKGKKLFFEILHLEPNIVLKPTDHTIPKEQRLHILV